jgi:hypothetical protein
VGHGPYRGWQRPGAAGGDSGQEARGFGRDGVSPSVPLHPVGTVSHRPFPGRPGEVGMARGTRALPGVAAAWGPRRALARKHGRRRALNPGAGCSDGFINALI